MGVVRGKYIGARLSEAMDTQGLDYVAVAALIGVSHSAIRGYVSNETSVIPRRAEQLSKALGVSVDWLYVGAAIRSTASNLAERRGFALTPDDNMTRDKAMRLGLKPGVQVGEWLYSESTKGIVRRRRGQVTELYPWHFVVCWDGHGECRSYQYHDLRMGRIRMEGQKI